MRLTDLRDLDKVIYATRDGDVLCVVKNISAAQVILEEASVVENGTKRTYVVEPHIGEILPGIIKYDPARAESERTIKKIKEIAAKNKSRAPVNPFA